ncbi:MAG: DinB family protein [Verrucomicrobiota bacterium]
MKKLLMTIGLTVFCGALIQAQNLTEAELTKGVQVLERSRAQLYRVTAGLTPEQWNFKPATNKWSIAQVVEHLAAAEDFFLANMETNIMKAPPREKTADLAALDAFVLQAVADRSKKVQAPEPLQPVNRFGSPKDSLQHFRMSRSKTIQFLKETQNLRGHATDSPLGKQLDAYEWLLFAAAHTERHIKQIEEIEADPNFPKKS